MIDEFELFRARAFGCRHDDKHDDDDVIATEDGVQQRIRRSDGSIESHDRPTHFRFEHGGDGQGKTRQCHFVEVLP